MGFAAFVNYSILVFSSPPIIFAKYLVGAAGAIKREVRCKSGAIPVAVRL